MKRKLILTTLFSVILILILASSVFANFQSIPTGNAYEDYKASAWILQIRQMEASGQGMGLNETINTSTLESTTSNNIDVHMIKNTEYGAIVLLGASEYGKQGQNTTTASTSRYMNYGSVSTSGTATNLATSTGNVYGIYELGYYNMSTSKKSGEELTAAGGSSFISTSIASRYINRYTTSTDSARIGDATVETKEWHNSEASWLSNTNYGFYRGDYGAFSYNTTSTTGFSRAIVVCGTGL